MGQPDDLTAEQMNKQLDKSIILCNLSFFGGQMNDLLTLLVDRLTAGEASDQKPLTVVTPNPEQVVLTRNNPAFLVALQNADVRIPDGIGLIYASKILSWRYGVPRLTQRLAGKTIALKVLSWAEKQPTRVLVIGGRELGQVVGAAGTTAGNLGAYQLKPIMGENGLLLENTHWFWLEGYRQVRQPRAAEESALVSALDQLRPDVVFVAFGAPDQELWLESHLALLQAKQVKIAMVVGGAFDVLTGTLQPAPTWMEQSGLEWAYRLWQQPGRWRRQLRLLQFVWLTARGLFSRDLAGISSSGR